MPPALARADEQIVGPAKIDRRARQTSRTALRRGQSTASGSKQTRWRDLRAQQHADIKPFARRRVPGVIAAAAAGSLLIGKIDRPCGAPLRAAVKCIGVC